ncbi:MAG TPA: ABC transporter substrate-binding protein [Acidimicrobiales bacterium]|nr:ABC transporter substrate-binding protein [Acidimicrobiales bacterium]
MTATTISVGVPYVDVAAVKAVGVNLNWGSIPDAFNAIIANMNAHGGINGRKIVPYIVAVNPTGTAPAATACTQLTQDDHVFVAIAPLMPTCYLQNGVPVIASILATSGSSGLAQNFTLTPPASAYDPLQLSIFAKQGVFKGKKVALFAGTTSDQPEVQIVQTTLTKLHVPVVTTAVDSAPQGDLVASNTQVTAIAQRFKSDGITEVVAVGNGSAIWPQGLSAIQSTYNPSWVATSESDLSGDVAGDNNPTYLRNVVTSSPLTPPQAIWDNAGTQQCVHIVKKAYPSDHINAYSPTSPGSQFTWMSVELACTDLALFAVIAKAAGKHLTAASFVHAGYGLRNLTIPGTGSPISFGPNRPFALGPVYMVHYDVGTKALVFATKSANS